MQTLFIGKSIIFLPQIHSTNSYAIDLLKNVNLPEGTVVHAEHQTRGKGQRENVWISDSASNLTASIIIKPSFLYLKNQFYLYLISALALYDTTAELLGFSQYDIKIKWPNDILVNKKKVAGILIENKLINSVISHSVVGIGLNVNQKNFNLEYVTSIRNMGAEEQNISKVLERICYYFEYYYLKLKANKLKELKSEYASHLYGMGELLPFKLKGKMQQFKVLGVAESGLLSLESEEGEEFHFDVKEITWII